MKIGLYGGSFNPPHNGHKRASLAAAELCGLEKVIIMPTAVSPHKAGLSLATAEDRLRMCRLCFHEELFEVSDYEIKKGGKSYTVETLRALKAARPGDEIILIVGSDMLLSFEKWVGYKEILSLCRLCAFSRENAVSPAMLYDYAERVLGLGRDELTVAGTPAYEIASTEVRSLLEAGEDIGGFVEESVKDYIRERKVYVPDTARNAEFDARIKEMLRPERYIHSLNVAESARQLALRYGADAEKAYTAGLLHDITKYLSPEEHKRLIALSGHELTADEETNPSLWHAMSAAGYLNSELNIKDSEIIGAVRYHTTGKKGMTLLEKIVYIADYISAERNYPDVEKMRELAEISLDKAALYALQYCIKKLIADGKTLHTDSVDFYNELIISKKEET